MILNHSESSIFKKKPPFIDLRKNAKPFVQFGLVLTVSNMLSSQMTVVQTSVVQTSVVQTSVVQTTVLQTTVVQTRVARRPSILCSSACLFQIGDGD